MNTGENIAFSPVFWCLFSSLDRLTSYVALPQYSIAVAKAKYVKVMPMLKHYVNELELYNMANGILKKRISFALKLALF
ncbi:MAG: hypothetical protein IJ016_02625 [Elusimicrobiaceae bacterium]|nr:hypothetical protein [Elusimicrobiaceae bacterium]